MNSPPNGRIYKLIIDIFVVSQFEQHCQTIKDCYSKLGHTHYYQKTTSHLSRRVLREEFIEQLGISQREFADKIGVTHTRLNQIVNEKRSITADTALRLSKALGTAAEFWMNLQGRYDLDHTRDEYGKKLIKRYAGYFMRKQGSTH